MKSMGKIAMALAMGLCFAGSQAETAAAEPGCAATVYFDAGFRGPARTLYGSVGFVGHYWNDQISAIVIHRGQWVFFQDAGFQGAALPLGPGEYPFVGNQWNDQISSARCISPTW